MIKKTYESRLQNFNSESLPDLDAVVLGALEFLEHEDIPTFDPTRFTRPLVIGSGNAILAGKNMFARTDAVFAEEENYQTLLKTIPSIDAIYIISASGGKHAIGIAEHVATLGLPLFLVTNNSNAPTKAYVPEDHVYVFPHIREPYTYNTSTYLSMILGVSHESPKEILEYIEGTVAKTIPPNFNLYHAFVLVTPPEFSILRGMFETKFDELFGVVVPGRAFTSSELMHAKTVVPSDIECYIDFGTASPPLRYVKSYINIPIPKECGPAMFLAIGYYVIGQIQKSKPPFFKKNIKRYVEEASEFFGQKIDVIAE